MGNKIPIHSIIWITTDIQKLIFFNPVLWLKTVSEIETPTEIVQNPIRHAYLTLFPFWLPYTQELKGKQDNSNKLTSAPLNNWYAQCDKKNFYFRCAVSSRILVIHPTALPMNFSQ